MNLYESNTRLIFYYNQNRPNGETRKTVEDNAQEETFQKVDLRNTFYGKIENEKGYSKNLRHKLPLDGRWTIKQAPISPNDKWRQNAEKS